MEKNNTVNITIAALKKLVDLRYQTEQVFLNSMKGQTHRMEDTPFKILFESGIEMSKMFIDSRYNIENKFLNGVGLTTSQKSEPQEKESSISIQKIVKPKPIPSGTITVTTQKQKLVSIPLNVVNHQDKELEIEASITDFRNTLNRNILSEKAHLRNPKELVNAKASTIFYVDIKLNDKDFNIGEKYSSQLFVKGVETRSFDLIIDLVEKMESGGGKPIISFASPNSK